MPTYETASTRQFRLARTETLRSCTAEVTEFCRAMTSREAGKETRLALLKTAYAKHMKLLAEASNGNGIDRHLFGLYITAIENGKPVRNIKASLKRSAYVVLRI